MASEALQMLNLSPIPELSEMELSTVLEQLSSVSDLNGDIPDRNVEDILREAEELIESSPSIKADSVDSSKQNECANDTNTNFNPCLANPKDEDTKLDSCDLSNEILELSSCSEDNSQRNSHSDSVKSNKNEYDISQTDLSSSRTSKSITNHIQSTLDSLRECSKKIENKSKVLSSDRETPDRMVLNTIIRTDKLITDKGEKLRNVKSSKLGFSGEEIDNQKLGHLYGETNTNTNFKKGKEKDKTNKKEVKGLDLSESIRTLDCFERLYRGKPTRDSGEIRRLKMNENKLNDKKTKGLRVIKTATPVHKEKMLKVNKKTLEARKTRSQVSKPLNFKVGALSENENLTDEEISFEKCLRLLQDETETESQPNIADITSYNCVQFTEKMLKQYMQSMSALVGEIEDLKCEVKKKNLKDFPQKDTYPMEDVSQENLIHRLKEENSKLFKEIEDIKGQLNLGGVNESNDDSVRDRKASENVEAVEKLQIEVDNLKRSLITAYLENNGILRLEEQFSSLKQKYDQQIDKLEGENKKLKERLGGQDFSSRELTGLHETVREIGVQTEQGLNPRHVKQMFDSATNTSEKQIVRSVSLENCMATVMWPTSFSQSCENVDAATSPIRGSYPQAEKELCSVSVQCKGESDYLDESDKTQNATKRGPFKDFQKLDNKENVGMNRKSAGKARNVSNSTNQILGALKPKRMTEHENQLMITVRALHSEMTVKDRDNKKMRNELELLRSQLKRLGGGIAKHKSDTGRRFCHVGTQTIGLTPKTLEAYDPAMFQVSRELEIENDDLKAKIKELEKIIIQLKDKRINDLKILQKLHEEEIEKLASRLNTQTALTNHLHALLSNR